MNILHLLSQNHLTGAEVYAVTLAHDQIDNSHQVFQLSNDFFYPSRAVQLRLEVETKKIFIFLKNVLWLRNFIRKQNIHVVHAHSRAAAKLAYWAVLFSKTAQISTVHGVQHSSVSKRLHNQYGEFIIAVCENIKVHLTRDFKYSHRRIKTIMNPVRTSDFFYLPRPHGDNGYRKIAIVGRTTGPKGLRTELVIKALNLSSHEVTLIGGAVADLKIEDSLKSRIRQVKTVGLNSQVYADYDLIIGSGRVCMEALMSGVPTIAFGEAHYFGFVTPENFKDALISNFGDIAPESKIPKLDAAHFARDLQRAPENSAKLAELARLKFSLEPIAAQILRIYESAYFLKNYSQWIPVLMYHKIPDQPIDSKHKIFVTKSDFEKHLNFFRRRGLKTLTFWDLKQFRTGEKSFADFPKKPLLLTFDDGYRDNLENAAPLLALNNFTAQIFLLADPGVDRNFWDQNTGEKADKIVSGHDRQKWADSPFEIGSHGFSHRKLTEMDPVSALTELIESKKSLEQEFKRPVNVFAYTYGITTPDSAELAQRAGYEYAVNTDTGGILLEEDPYSIFRVNIFPDETWWSLYKKTSKWYRRYYFLKRKK